MSASLDAEGGADSLSQEVAAAAQILFGAWRVLKLTQGVVVRPGGGHDGVFVECRVAARHGGKYIELHTAAKDIFANFFSFSLFSLCLSLSFSLFLSHPFFIVASATARAGLEEEIVC